MTLVELIRQARRESQDTVEPYLVEDEDLTDLFNEAEMEAAIRGRLIHEYQHPDISQINVTAGNSYYPLHRTLYELTSIRLVKSGSIAGKSIRLKSTESLDVLMPDWRSRTGVPEYAVQDDTGLRLVPMPTEDGVLYLEGFRLPQSPMAADGDEPEIHRAHHGYLCHWVLHKVFSRPESDLFDPNRSVLSEREFTQHFGMRPDSDLRRIVRVDELHVVEPMLI